MKVQRIRVPDTGHLSWIVVDGEHLPVSVLNEYLLYLHRLGRSPNTVRAYAHHLQSFWAFLTEQDHDWQSLKLTQLAEFVSWVRYATRAGGQHRSDATINLILAAIGSFYEYQDRLGEETAISRSRRFGAKSPYKPFLHHISRTQSLRQAVVRVKSTKRLPRVFSPSEVQSLLDACIRLRDRLLLCLLHESGMRIREAWLPVGPERLIYDEEVPQPPKPQPRYLPSAVLDQLNRHLDDLRAPWRRMILILQECGMRISELLELPVDCLTQDARGVHYLRYLQGKVRRENAIPVSTVIASLVQEQQATVRAGRIESAVLFPNSKGGVLKQASFAHRINRLAYDHDIRGADGKLFRFQAHQFRHTVGTRMVNLGVPHHIIQRYLGHKGPEMTSRYAHIHDVTMRDKLSEYLKSTLIDVSGKVVAENGVNDTADLQWFTRSVLAQALTNGYCAIPIVAGPCPHPNACLNCAHFRTDATFLEVHRAELRETERVIAKADANGWVRQSEMNERKRTSLVNIVTTLEASRG